MRLNTASRVYIDWEALEVHVTIDTTPETIARLQDLRVGRLVALFGATEQHGTYRWIIPLAERPQPESTP